VVLLQDPPIPRSLQQQTHDSGNKKVASASNKDDKFTPPSKATIAKISKFQYHWILDLISVMILVIYIKKLQMFDQSNEF